MIPTGGENGCIASRRRVLHNHATEIDDSNLAITATAVGSKPFKSSDTRRDRTRPDRARGSSKTVKRRNRLVKNRNIWSRLRLQFNSPFSSSPAHVVVMLIVAFSALLTIASRLASRLLLPEDINELPYSRGIERRNKIKDGDLGARGKQLRRKTRRDTMYNDLQKQISDSEEYTNHASLNGLNGAKSPVQTRLQDRVKKKISSLSLVGGLYDRIKRVKIGETNEESVGFNSEKIRDEEGTLVMKFPQSIHNELKTAMNKDNQESYHISEFEEIAHPGHLAVRQLKQFHDGDNSISNEGEGSSSVKKIIVPKFWIPSLGSHSPWNYRIFSDANPPPRRSIMYGGDKQYDMTKSQALSIGSKIPSSFVQRKNDDGIADGKSALVQKEEHNTNKENANEEMLETIFIAIASYRDYECTNTVMKIFERAKFPERVRVGVVDQRIVGAELACGIPEKSCDVDPNQTLCRYSHLIDVYTMEASLAVGPVFARHVGHRMYRGEYFVAQVDAHVRFIQDWDEHIIAQWKRIGNEMAVISTYLSDVQSYDESTGKSLVSTRPIMCAAYWEGGEEGEALASIKKKVYLRNDAQPESSPSALEHGPQIHTFWAAGFSFGRGHFILNVPYDQYLPMIFQGEEFNIGLRGFTYGYDYYAPDHSVCFHIYAEGKNAKRRETVGTFWENTSLYEGVSDYAKSRLLGLIGLYGDGNGSIADGVIVPWDHTDEDIYGLGRVRDAKRFYETFGIHVDSRTMEHHLCSFVDSALGYEKIGRFLKSDGMGIDYSRVEFKFIDPHPEMEETIFLDEV